jgi:hypothetical protein
MKIDPGMGNVIYIIKPEDRQQKRIEETIEQKKRIVDTISLENRRASESHIENVEQAKHLLNQVVSSMQGSSSDLYNLNLHRVMNLIH